MKDVVYAGLNGDVWWLGLPEGSVIAHGNEGNRVVIRAPTTSTLIAGCSSDGRLVSFAELLAPGVIRLQPINWPDSNVALTVPADFSIGDGSAWAQVRLGGAPGHPCVLIAPRVGHFAVINGDSAIWTAPFHEPLLMALPRGRWARFLDRFRGPPPPPPVGPLDATSFAGGYAILYQGATAEAGRLVDLYDRGGRYTQTMILPQPALRIASTGTQLLTLSHRDKRWRIASYWFPRDQAQRGPVDTVLPTRLPRP